jgi:hypothetical protein
LEKAPVSNTGKKTGFYHIISTAKAGAQIHFSLVQFLEKAVKIGGKHCCFYSLTHLLVDCRVGLRFVRLLSWTVIVHLFESW